MRGISTLKYFGLSKDYSNSIYKTSEDFRKETMGALRIAMLSTFALDFFASLSVAVVALFLGLRLMSGDILLFPALAALILAPEYFLPLRDFASDYHATLNGKNALAAVNEVLSTEENTLSVLTEKVTWSANSQLQLTELGKIYDTGRGISNVILSVNGFKKIAPDELSVHQETKYCGYDLKMLWLMQHVEPVPLKLYGHWPQFVHQDQFHR